MRPAREALTVTATTLMATVLVGVLALAAHSLTLVYGLARALRTLATIITTLTL